MGQCLTGPFPVIVEKNVDNYQLLVREQEGLHLHSILDVEKVQSYFIAHMARTNGIQCSYTWLGQGR